MRRSRSRSWSRSRTRRASPGYSRSPKYRKERHSSREVKREGHRSAHHTMHSKSLSKDSREGSLENDSSTCPAERRHKAEARDTVKKSSRDVMEHTDKKITSQGMSRGDHKSAHYSRHSNSMPNDSKSGGLEIDMCTSPPEMRERSLEITREDSQSTCHLKDLREGSLENDMGISSAQRRYKTKGGVTAKKNALNAKEDTYNMKTIQEVKKEDHISAYLSRRSRSISEDSREGSLDKDLSIPPAERRNTSRELKREDHKSTCNCRHSKSISKDFKEGSLEKDSSGCPAESMGKVEGEDAVRKDVTDVNEAKDNGSLGKSESRMKYLEHLNAKQVVEKQSDPEMVARENQEDKCNRDLTKFKTLQRKAKTMEDVMVEENIENIKLGKYSSAGQRNFYSEDGETHEKSGVYVKKKEFRENVDDIDRYKEKKRRRNEKGVDSERELREMIRQGKENELVEEGAEQEEIILRRKDKKLVEDEEEDRKQKKRFKKVREVNYKKKRKRHESRHRKEDGGEKKDKRRKKHKRHRHRSASYSTELSSVDATEGNDKNKRKHKR